MFLLPSVITMDPREVVSMKLLCRSCDYIVVTMTVAKPHKTPFVKTMEAIINGIYILYVAHPYKNTTEILICLAETCPFKELCSDDFVLTCFMCHHYQTMKAGMVIAHHALRFLATYSQRLFCKLIALA